LGGEIGIKVEEEKKKENGRERSTVFRVQIVVCIPDCDKNR
jgi:hypothetical protein